MATGAYEHPDRLESGGFLKGMERMIIATAALALSSSRPVLPKSGHHLRDLVRSRAEGPGFRTPPGAGRPSRDGAGAAHPGRAEDQGGAGVLPPLQAGRGAPAEEAAHLTRTYSLVGLVDEDLDLRELLVSVYQEQVAGFYDPDSTALFVMDDMPAETMLESVLIHELVHAVQDQTANLDSLTAEERGNDRQAAAQSAIEGHATLIMLEYMLEQMQGRASGPLRTPGLLPGRWGRPWRPCETNILPWPPPRPLSRRPSCSRI